MTVSLLLVICYTTTQFNALPYLLEMHNVTGYFPSIRRPPISESPPPYDSARHPPVPKHSQDLNLDQARPAHLHLHLGLAHSRRHYPFGKILLCKNTMICG